jgi:uncharacterized protein (DUF58 family)
MLSTLWRMILCVPLALAMLVGTPTGTYRLERESEEAPVPVGEETSSQYAVPSSAREARRVRHAPQSHFHAQSCASRRGPASSGAGQRFSAKDGHQLANGLRAPLLT